MVRLDNKEMSLYDRIICDENIYQAIYCLESYVFEKGLLSDEDKLLYNSLNDKFNKAVILDEITKCKNKLKIILESEELFTVNVYYKIKSLDSDKEKVQFRPLHTASLLDQICMVCMLQPLMYNDIEDVHQLSDLSKILPHNFYGNVPSSNIEFLFEKWQRKYKEYSENIIFKCKAYQESRRYKYQVSLDLKDFYPSIDPCFVYNYVFDKLQFVYKGDDRTTLQKILCKLLYFHIETVNVKGAEELYYHTNTMGSTVRAFMNRGIPQGLPQSYFFANLVMVEVAKVVEKYFPGESFYYVDDSVIYTNNVDENSFDNMIIEINKDISEIQKLKFSNIQPPISIDDMAFQKKLEYNLQFHEEGKSSCSLIEEAFDGTEGLQFIARQISLSSRIYDNVDEIDDSISIDKLDRLIEAINYEKEEIGREFTQNRKGNKSLYKIKLLKRFKRYFLFRKRLLCIRKDGSVSHDYLENYYSRYHIEKKRIKIFEDLDEEIFQTESLLLAQLLNQEDYNQFYTKVCQFEKSLLNKSGANSSNEGLSKFLYYSRNLKRLDYNHLNIDLSYLSLKRYAYNKLKTCIYTTEKKKEDIISKFLDNPIEELGVSELSFTSSVRKKSNEFLRKVYNTFFSYLFNIEVSDRVFFYKVNYRAVTYKELRVLMYLRNRRYTKRGFHEFYSSVSQEDVVLNNTHIDVTLMEVLNIFMRKIQEPKRIDDLIVTHRLVNGLWKNGSKFLHAYTLHNEEHAIMLIKQSLIILRDVDILSLKSADYYILFLACYLHDISMVIHPNLEDFLESNIETENIVTECMLSVDDSENVTNRNGFHKMILTAFERVYYYFEDKIRKEHPWNSAMFIKAKNKTFLSYLEAAVVELVALIAESHGFDSCEVYGRKSDASNSCYSIKYMMIIIRLADLMDMSNDRISYYLLRQNIKHLAPISRFHWISHLVTDNVRIIPDYNFKEERLVKKPITETIHFKIYLNVDYKFSIEGFNCKPWSFEEVEVSKTEEDKDFNCFQFTIASDDGKQGELEITDQIHPCPFLCAWMRIKHDYLFNELACLQDYINKSRTSFFRTVIKIDILSKNKRRLENDMRDDINEFILKKIEDNKENKGCKKW